MWFEIPTMIIATMLSLAGVSVPQLQTELATPAALSCDAQGADNCLASDACDLFVGASGAETCAVACDMRDLNSCLLDANCAVVDGVCDYADHNPVGC